MLDKDFRLWKMMNYSLAYRGWGNPWGAVQELFSQDLSAEQFHCIFCTVSRTRKVEIIENILILLICNLSIQQVGVYKVLGGLGKFLAVNNPMHRICLGIILSKSLLHEWNLTKYSTTQPRHWDFNGWRKTHTNLDTLSDQKTSCMSTQ